MRTGRKILFFALCLIVPVALHAAAAVPKSVVGTWKLNLAKSTFEGVPTPRSQTRVYQDWGGGLIHATFEGIDAQGKRTVSEFVARYDGRDYPRLALRSETAGTIALKHLTDREIEYIYKEDGKVTITGTRTISADGKSYTSRYSGKNAHGQTIRASMVFDRQ
jgi:hypothetical protein